jgi:putative hydrolase of HD superfamily
MDLERLVDFVHFTHAIRKIERAIEVHGGSRAENDQEHSFQLALVAWFLNEHDHLQLDTSRIIGLALVHDLLEVHAGDTYAYAKSDIIKSQTYREKQAVEKLKEDWPDFPSIHELIAEYEACATPEAKFVYSLDKLLPMLNNYTDTGRSWKNKGVKLEHVRAVKTGKADRSPFVADYFNNLMKQLEAHPEFFTQLKP